MQNKLGYIYIFLAGICWSSIGFIVSKISDYNFSSDEIAFFRLSIGFIIISIYGKMKEPNMFKVTKKGIIYVIAIGLISQFLFNSAYMSSIQLVGSSMAAVLLYTSPIFVALFSKIVYKENINNIKIISLILCMIGAFLAVTGGSIDMQALNIAGIFAGVLSAITYALMPIFSKNALNEMDNLTMIAYSFLIGAIAMTFKINPVETFSKVNNISILSLVVALGFIPSALAYILYSQGILKKVELSIAGVIASVELVFSAIIGWALLGDDFSIVKLIGVLFMILSTLVAVKSIDNKPGDEQKVSSEEDDYDFEELDIKSVN